MISIVTGDIFNSQEKYLCHQCNCVTQNSVGIAKAIFDKYPYADIYAARQDPSTPGTIVIRGNGQDQRYVVNMLGQYYPGTPKYPTSDKDGSAAREKYFYRCLLALSKVANLESVAFPWKIGCNLGGGNWNNYLGNITNFAHYIEKTQGARVIIYRRDGD